MADSFNFEGRKYTPRTVSALNEMMLLAGIRIGNSDEHCAQAVLAESNCNVREKFLLMTIENLAAKISKMEVVTAN